MKRQWQDRSGKVVDPTCASLFVTKYTSIAGVCLGFLNRWESHNVTPPQDTNQIVLPTYTRVPLNTPIPLRVATWLQIKSSSLEIKLFSRIL